MSRKLALFPAVQELIAKSNGGRRIHYSTIWRAYKAGRFPCPVRLPGGQVAWYTDELDEWFEKLPRVGTADDPGVNGARRGPPRKSAKPAVDK